MRSAVEEGRCARHAVQETDAAAAQRGAREASPRPASKCFATRPAYGMRKFPVNVSDHQL
eukprot:6177290-Pleurochrysis_carterae.AAC.5